MDALLPRGAQLMPQLAVFIYAHKPERMNIFAMRCAAAAPRRADTISRSYNAEDACAHMFTS